MPDLTDQRRGRATTAAAAALAAQYAERLVVGTVRDVHRAVSRRSFALTGPASAPARLLHDGVSAATYGVISGAFRTAGTLLEQLDRRGVGPGLDEHRAGRRLAAIVNGLVGETLEESGHPMAIRMAARVDGQDVADLAAGYPDATGDVVLFLHGLVEDDESWRWGSEGRPTYAEALAVDTTWTPVTLRYNTGLPVARNGALLSDWISALLRDWPTPVRRLALVGHSMGGLVALSACEHGSAAEAEWTRRVRHVLCLGTPHLGAPLEQLVHRGARALSLFPESTPFATILNTRSAGILDLRRAAVECTPLDGTAYHCVSGSLGGPWGPLLGDLLVRRDSATGRIPGATAQHLPATHHFRLLNHPEVYAELRRRLTEPPTEDTAAG